MFVSYSAAIIRPNHLSLIFQRPSPFFPLHILSLVNYFIFQLASKAFFSLHSQGNHSSLSCYYHYPASLWVPRYPAPCFPSTQASDEALQFLEYSLDIANGESLSWLSSRTWNPLPPLQWQLAVCFLSYELSTLQRTFSPLLLRHQSL